MGNTQTQIADTEKAGQRWERKYTTDLSTRLLKSRPPMSEYMNCHARSLVFTHFLSRPQTLLLANSFGVKVN